MEYWRNGVLECRKKLKPKFQLEKILIITPLLHHSSRLPHQAKTLKAPSGAAQRQVLPRMAGSSTGLDSLLFLFRIYFAQKGSDVCGAHCRITRFIGIVRQDIDI